MQHYVQTKSTFFTMDANRISETLLITPHRLKYHNVGSSILCILIQQIFTSYFVSISCNFSSNSSTVQLCNNLSSSVSFSIIAFWSEEILQVLPWCLTPWVTSKVHLHPFACLAQMHLSGTWPTKWMYMTHIAVLILSKVAITAYRFFIVSMSMLLLSLNSWNVYECWRLQGS